MQEGGKIGVEIREGRVSSDELNLPEKGQVRDKIAKQVGLSPTTFQRGTIVLRKGTSDQIRKVKSGEASVTKTYEDIMEDMKKPKGPYVQECGVEWVDYTLNIGHGCSHGCTYCYGRRMNDRFGWVDKWEEPELKDIDLFQLAKELSELPPGKLFFCSVTDPFQPEMETRAMTILGVLAPIKHITTKILTKSSLVEKALQYISRWNNFRLGFTITCLDDVKNRLFEPHSSPPSERIRVLRKAHDMGIQTFVSVEPWITGHTDPIAIVTELHDVVDTWIFGVHNYAGVSLDEYLPLIGDLTNCLVKVNANFLMKAELDRVFKSKPIMSRAAYMESREKLVGDQ